MKTFCVAHPCALLIAMIPVAWLLFKASQWIVRELKDISEDLEEYRYYLNKEDDEHQGKEKD